MFQNVTIQKQNTYKYANFYATKDLNTALDFTVNKINMSLNMKWHALCHVSRIFHD